ncbi:MAG: polyprenol monophosphomannose synthase [Candidatus Methylarchaceae archaeon HK02M2]|nr:polyprenol monophosphomannose synthase [Candidatus Methylarchaceae archaeon HK02M2]
MARISVLIPTYNERDNISTLIDEIFNYISRFPYDVHIVVIDDNSSDGTGQIVAKIAKNNDQVHLLSRPGKYGLGSAYIHGFRWSESNLSPHIFVQMDADFSHPPRYLTTLIKNALSGYDVVIGSRYIEGGGSVSWSLHRKIISMCANSITRLMVKIREKDATSGFRALSRRAVHTLLNFDLNSKGYAYQIESLFLYSRLGLSIKEIPILFFERRKGATKLSILDILNFIYLVLIMNVSKSKAIKQFKDIQRQYKGNFKY